MKKIIAGVLAAASMLAVSASAFAASDEKTVTKAGDISYDVGITAPKITLNLVMPAKMAAALNPYGADIVIGVKSTDADTKVTSNKGIASVAYQVVNKSEDYGVYIDATALTTVTTTDKTKWVVKEANDGTKGAALALTAAATPEALAALAVPSASAAASGTTTITQGSLLLDSSAAADKDKGLVAGQVQQTKMMFLPATTDADNPTTYYMGFIGTLAKSTTGAGAKEVVWNEDDAINVALVLKVSAGPKKLS